MEFTNVRIMENSLNVLDAAIYVELQPINQWMSCEEHYTAPAQYERTCDWHPIQMGQTWKCGDGITRRFKTTVAIPAQLVDKQLALVLDVGGEGLVRINGKIISGVTSYLPGSRLAGRMRTRVLLTNSIIEDQPLEIEVEACLNFMEFIQMRRNGHTSVDYTLRTAFLAVIDEEIEEYYFDIRCAMDAMATFQNPVGSLANSNAQLNPAMQELLGALGRESYLYDKLSDAVLRSLNALETGFGVDRLRAAIPSAKAILSEALASLPKKAYAMVKFVGQAHIDTAWLWTIKESVRKCGKTFANTLALMEQYPEYIFAFSQPQLFAYTEEFYPELFERIVERVGEGRIELVGNAWVEMDTNVPSGESLVRHLLYGRQYFLDKFGKASSVFWMPDVFGYSWALPQIMIRSGVDYFFTSKLVNNDTNRFPHSLFNWQGVDGTRILSYLQRLNYNGELNAKTLSEIHQRFNQKNVCDTALMTIGYGDGGGGPSYQMLENAKRLKEFPGLPNSKMATALSFFESVKQVSEQLPVWNDEMYYEFHRGTYTSQANTKKNNRKAELLLRQTEMVCTFAHTILNKPYPAKEIGDIYKQLLTNQFHDILPGSSIHEVYEDCDRSFAQIFTAANSLFDDAIASLNAAITDANDEIIVWNFLSWPHSGSVRIQISDDNTQIGLKDENGEVVASSVEISNDGKEILFYATDVPPMGYKVYHITDYTEQAKSVHADGHTLENRFLCMTLDANGNIASLFDKENHREVMTNYKPSNLLTIFDDSPHGESAWNIDLEYQNKFWELIEAESVMLVEASPVRGVIRVVRKFNLSTITQDIVLGCDAHRVDFVTTVNWYETERMLKAAFYPDVLASKATYEIQFGAIERPTHWNTSYDKARFEVCGHKWADLSEGLYGISLLNDCKYGYDIKDNQMRLTLLRSPNYPDPTADKGVHAFTYSIYPHSGDWRNGETVREAYQLNVPLYPYAGQGDSDCKLPNQFSFAKIDHGNVVIDTIKCSENSEGIILRVYESQGARGKVSIAMNTPLRRVMECNLMEQDEHEVMVSGESFEFFIKPYEIKTFRLKL